MSPALSSRRSRAGSTSSLRPAGFSTPLAPSSAPATSSSARKRCRSYGPGMASDAGLLRREAEAPVIRRIADQQDRAVAEARGLRDRMPHQRRADAGALQRRIDGERPEQQRGRTALAQPRRPTAAPCRRLRPSASRATKARPSDGRRPRRSFSDDLRLRRSAPWRGRAALRAQRRRQRISATIAKAGDWLRRFQLAISISAILHERRSVPQANPSPAMTPAPG